MNNILEISRPVNELNLKLKNDLDISRNNKDFIKTYKWTVLKNH